MQFMVKLYLVCNLFPKAIKLPSMTGKMRKIAANETINIRTTTAAQAYRASLP